MAEKIGQFIRARWIVVSGILIIVIIESIFGIASWPMTLFTYIILVIDLLFNALWTYWVSRKKFLDLCVYLQVAVDLICIMLAIYLTGGIENTWGFVPVTIIVVVGTYLSFWASVGIALGAVFLFAAMAFAETSGFIPHFSAYGFSESVWKNKNYVLDYIVGMAMLYLSSAFISGYFGERVRESNIWLEKEVDRLKSQLGKKLEETNQELYQRNSELEKSLSEQKQIKGELRKSEEGYKTILHAAIDGFWVTDLQGKFLDVNDAYCQMVGYSREELLRMRIADIEAIEKPEETAERIKKIIKIGGDRFETRHRRKDGKIIDAEISVNFAEGEGGRLFVFARDITERKRAAEEFNKKMGELETFYKVSMDREDRIMELKAEIERLKEMLNER